MKILLLIALGVTVAVAENSQLFNNFAVGSNQFSGEVYKELLKSNSGSFLVCPISAEMVLALAHAGAGGNTAKQISNTLHLPQTSDKIEETFRKLSPHLKGNQYFTLNSANKIYVQDGLKINAEFKSTAVDVFDAGIQNIDFANTQQAASEMNSWIEDKTHDKIKNMIDANSLDGVSTVLINAMYFNGKWATPFKKDNTKQKPFYLNNEHQVQIDMMSQMGYYKYYESEELKAKLLEIPYAADERDYVTMTIALPNDKDGLSALESHIGDIFHAFPQDQYHHAEVHTVIPKFKIETTIQFNSILQNLGIVDAFGDNADFTRIIDGQSLAISKVFQKAFIEVEEEGTVATAATVMQMYPMSSNYQPPQPKEFVADHPFVFFIKVKGVVIFVGRYSAAE